MPRRSAEHVREPLLVRVDRTRDERRLGADRDRERVERVVERAERRRLRHLAELGRRRVLALREPVDAVVEEEDLQVHVATQRVDEVVPADRQRVAVARDHPDREIRPRHRESGRDRRRAAVDRVHPVGLHVVREARRAADAGHEHDPLALETELGHEALDDVEDRVVAAARAPANFLVGLEVLAGQLNQVSVAVGHQESTSAVIASASSAARNGRPRTLLYPAASTRNCARISMRSCPRFISGMSTLS